MKNIIVSIFSDESKTYEALSNLKTKAGSTVVISAGILKNENGNITIKDGFNTDDIGSSWAVGGLLGGLIGVLGGPIGVLLGGSLGSLLGASVDVDESDVNESVIQKVLSKLENYKLALFILADEENVNELNEFLNSYGVSEIIREGFSEVQSEVYEVEELQEELLKETKKRLRKEKREARKEKWNQKIDKCKKRFSK